MITSKIKYGSGKETPVRGESICSFENKFVFVTGCSHPYAKDFRDVVRLDLVSCKWVKEPNMNYGHAFHSSCVFQNAVFVFCGT